MLNPKLKNPRNAAGVIITLIAFAIHAADLIGYSVPDWLAIAAIFLYPIGFALLIIADRKTGQ